MIFYFYNNSKLNKIIMNCCQNSAHHSIVFFSSYIFDLKSISFYFHLNIFLKNYIGLDNEKQLNNEFTV